MSEKENSEKKELEEAIEELDSLNPEDKEVYRVDGQTLKLSQVDYRIIENYQEAFDLEQMENRYSDYLLKYDYIVGDISYQKLRLRGFFENYRKGVPIDMKIAHLEDYLVEYCSFGSPYFVLERVNKKEADPESYFKKKQTSRGRRRKAHGQKKKETRKLSKKKPGKTASRSNENKADSKKQFKIRKKKD